VESGFIDEQQIKFWHKFYLNGLGEFFIKNNFNFKNILNFKNTKNSKLDIKKIKISTDKSLLMW
jgi:hypothetical protein